MTRYIIADGAREGGYRRGDLKGDVLWAMYSYAEVSGLVIPGRTACMDAYADRMREKGLIDGELAARYALALNELMGRLCADDGATFESIYAAVRRLRADTFGQTALDQAFLADARGDQADMSDMDIDQRDRGEGLVGASEAVLFALDDARLFSAMRRDMDAARALGKRVVILCADGESALLPRREVLEALCGPETYAALADDGLLRGDDQLIAAVDGGRACLRYYGETGLGRVRRCAVPALITCVAASFPAKAMLGQFTRRGPCAVFVPAGFDILPYVPLSRRTLASYRTFARLSAAHGDAAYAVGAEELYRRWPGAVFSVYDEDEDGLPEGAAWPEAAASSGGWYADFCARRDAALGGLLGAVPGLTGFSAWFDLETLARGPIPWDDPGPARGIMVHGVTAQRVSDARVVLSEGAPISPRLLLRGAQDAPALQVMSNFLFFMTPRLCQLYDRLRADRPREQSAMRGGHLDYMLRFDGQGRRVETFPLYRKACMGMTEDGRFLFFHFRLRGGSCSVNGQTIRWEEADVDPADPGDVAVYTPYFSREDAGADRFRYTKAVGAGRVNLVVNQTELTCARDGDVLLPGTGVVLSLSREKGLELARACGFQPVGDGYFAWKAAPALETRLENPAEVDAETWAGMRWAYGGGLTLIKGGRSLFGEGADEGAHLADEGWTTPLSAQTQESDIAAPASHPRTAVGVTRGGALVMLVYSGRSAVSAGANYAQMCAIARKLVPDIADLMNVDGGGSAVLGLGVGQRFIEYSWPSSSPDSLPGMVRPVNSLLTLTLKA